MDDYSEYFPMDDSLNVQKSKKKSGKGKGKTPNKKKSKKWWLTISIFKFCLSIRTDRYIKYHDKQNTAKCYSGITIRADE